MVDEILIELVLALLGQLLVELPLFLFGRETPKSVIMFAHQFGFELFGERIKN